MTREEAIQFLDNIKHAEVGRAIGEEGFYAELIGYHVEALNVAIKALEHPERNVVAVVPCGDTISRQAVLDVLDENSFTDSCIKVRQLPSVNPQEPKIGHWVRNSMDKYTQHAQYYYKCSECREDVIGEHKFCPNCGARMVGEEDVSQ